MFVREMWGEEKEYSNKNQSHHFFAYLRLLMCRYSERQVIFYKCLHSIYYLSLRYLVVPFVHPSLICDLPPLKSKG